uniref:Deoxynucleoside kinase domain-containing protein n=1 Tax=viral metagenome TaxID=1070528 RepID=A0A6C0IV69_9ZZZZ
MYISLEGNIGSGKTTLFNVLEKIYKDKKFIKEPVDEWRKVKDSNDKNILELFYQNPKKWSFSFQICALNTKIEKLEKLNIKSDDIISERSILTDKYCFAKQLFEDECINEVDWKIYNSLHKNIDINLSPKAIIYLKCNPEICFERIKIRDRKEELNIDLNYLTKINNKHLEWLSNIGIPVLEIDTNINYLENNVEMQRILVMIDNFLKQF